MFKSRTAGLAAFVLSILSLSIPALAQQLPKTISAGIVNGRAVSLPKPAYPASAREAGISGIIAVDVLIDESGNVLSAVADVNDQRERRDIDGAKLDPLPADPALRASAEEAALKAKFSPSLNSGPPVQIKGRIVYNFVAEKSDTNVLQSAGPKAASVGILNGKALSLPKPEYPAAAKAVRAEGTVSVQVTIDEHGNVISAAAVSGHPLLRSAAESAARLATFAPTTLSGTAVRVSGILTYNFVLPKVETN